MSTDDLPPHRTVRVELGASSYDVAIGRGLLRHAKELAKGVKASLNAATLIVMDGNVPMKFTDELAASLGSEVFHILPSGERTKTLGDEQLIRQIASILKGSTKTSC